MYVCTAIRFVVLRGIELKIGIGVGDGPTRFVGIFSKRLHLGSKVVQLSVCLRNALWLSNLVRRTPDQSVVHCWCQKSCRDLWGQPGVKLLSNALWPPNLVGRISDQSVMHCWGQHHVGVSRGQVGVNLLSNAPWPPNLVGRIPDQSVMHCWGQRSCRGQLGSSKGQFV